MPDLTATLEVDYDDGFREGFLHGYMAAVMADPSVPCDHDDCPRQE